MFTSTKLHISGTVLVLAVGLACHSQEVRGWTMAALFGQEWVEFDFGPLELGLAAGTLAVKISTMKDGYCRVATSLDQVPGQLMLGDEVNLNYISTRDSGPMATFFEGPGQDGEGNFQPPSKENTPFISAKRVSRSKATDPPSWV